MRRTVEEDMLVGDTAAVDEVNWGEISRLAIGALSERKKDG